MEMEHSGTKDTRRRGGKRPRKNYQGQEPSTSVTRSSKKLKSAVNQSISDETTAARKRGREIEEASENPVHHPFKKRRKNNLHQRKSDERINVQEGQKLSELVDHCSVDGEEREFTSERNSLIPVVSLSDLPLLEAVFSIEKIRDAIFSLLEPRDLLQCRLVSSSWLRMATNNKLLEWKENIIVIHRNPENHQHAAGGRLGMSRTRGLEDLVDVLDGMAMGSYLFPSSSFEIMGLTIPPNDLFLKLFNRFGFIVKHLNVLFQGCDCQRRQSMVYQMDTLLEFVTKLLTEQMPNLSTLSVLFGPKAKFSGQIEPQLLVSIEQGFFCAGKQNQGLRTIQFDKQTPHEIIEAVCCLAPKVERVTAGDIGFWVGRKHLLHLLKEIKFQPSSKCLYQINSLKAILSIEGSLQIKKLTTDFFLIEFAPEMWPAQATLLKNILEKSCHSLEELHLDRMFHLPGTVFPRMPNVKLLSMISLDCITPDWTFLPQGISLVETFPKLLTINLHSSKFLSFCKDEKVASVKRITTCGIGIDERVFQKNFPNAVVTMR